jgi:hypothetical protein
MEKYTSGPFDLKKKKSEPHFYKEKYMTIPRLVLGIFPGKARLCILAKLEDEFI